MYAPFVGDRMLKGIRGSRLQSSRFNARKQQKYFARSLFFQQRDCFDVISLREKINRDDALKLEA
jgi:hypothetical protein